MIRMQLAISVRDCALSKQKKENHRAALLTLPVFKQASPRLSLSDGLGVWMAVEQ